MPASSSATKLNERPGSGLRARDGSASAGWRLAGVNRQLSVESPLVGGPRFAAGDIGGEGLIFVQKAGWFHPEQHPHHHQGSRAEPTIEPVGIPQPSRKLVPPAADAIL